MVNSWFGAAGENSTDQFNQQNETLHSAAGRGDSKMLQTLSSQKANIDALDAVTADTALTDHLVNEHSIASASS